MAMRRLLIVFVVAALASACGRTSPREGSGTGDPGSKASDPRSPIPDPSTRKYLVERVDDAAVVQYYADGFEKLPLREKTLVYHLYQAAVAGRDIFIDQKHRHALAMRGVFEAILTHADGVDAA